MVTASIWLAWFVACWESACIATLAGTISEIQHGDPRKAYRSMFLPMLGWCVAAVLATIAVNR
jgi:hypothetical protein